MKKLQWNEAKVFFFCVSQIGLAVGDIDSIQKNAELKRLAVQVCVIIISSTIDI